ncbi:hypothetical protein [Paraburkholderia sp.]|jgi:hypothetical protein|uniref:hypothetical protein n=1 Tax=Paraburkholderia sp. TaxID=1926495 RepID=UPI002F3ED78A
MSFEHRGFRVNVNVVPDEPGVQWVCRAVIERIDGDSAQGVPQDLELTMPRAKIDPLLAISTVEHQARSLIDESYTRLHGAVA